MLLLIRKKRGKKPGMRRTYFWSGPLPVTWLCHFRSKGPTRADMAQFPAAHAQNILPNIAHDLCHFRSRNWRYFRSRHFRSCAMVRSTSRSTSNETLSVPIYYWCTALEASTLTITPPMRLVWPGLTLILRYDINIIIQKTVEHCRSVWSRTHKKTILFLQCGNWFFSSFYYLYI
jgi:hypothetical protein